MPYAMSGQCKIYYESHGDGPPLVLVHGAGGNHAIWWQQVAHFQGSHRVITVDLRGFGCSDSVAEGPDTLDFPEDIRSVLEHAEAAPAVLLGQSIGAVAALRCAIKNPERIKAVVLANSVGGLTHPDLTPLVNADRARAEELTVIGRLLTKRFREEQADKMLLFWQIGSFNRTRWQDMRNLTSPGPTPDDLRAAEIRVCLIAGENDAVLSPATARVAQRLIPGSTLDIVAGAPHSMYWEAPELFNASLERSLNDIHGAT